jgi:hypothetical protein
MSGNWAKRAPLLGILSIAAIIAAFAVGGESPDADASAAKVVSFYTDHDSDQMFSSFLLSLGALFLVFFAGVLRNALRATEQGPGGLSAVSFGGALIMAVGFTLFAGISFTLGDVADKLDPTAAQALNALNGDLFFPLAMGTALFMLATGIAALRGGALPKWLGWIAIVLGVLALTPLGFFALMATGIWIIIASIVLATRTPAAA